MQQGRKDVGELEAKLGQTVNILRELISQEGGSCTSMYVGRHDGPMPHLRGGGSGQLEAKVIIWSYTMEYIRTLFFINARMH